MALKKVGECGGVSSAIRASCHARQRVASLRSLSCFRLCEQSGDLVWTIDFDTGEEKQRLCDNERVVREGSDV